MRQPDEIQAEYSATCQMLGDATLRLQLIEDEINKYKQRLLALNAEMNHIQTVLKQLAEMKSNENK